MSARGAFFASFGAAVLSAACQLAYAEIYLAELPGQAPAYASHPTDSAYRLYLRTESAAPPSTAQNRPKPPSPRELALNGHIESAAKKHQVDPALLRAVIETESRFNSAAVSAKGAVGAMQLMPGTARRFGVLDRSDPARNIDAGTAYLKELLTRFGGNLSLALAAYNAGEGAVIRHHRRIPDFRETMLYVPQVLAAYARYSQAKAVAE